MNYESSITNTEEDKFVIRNSQTRNSLIPQLRFPDFEKDGEWEEKTLDETCHVNPSSAALPSEFVYIDLESVAAGKLLKKNKIARDNAPSRAQRLLIKGDIIFQMVRPYQKNNLLFDIESELNFVASTGYAQLRAFQSGKYLYQYLHTDKFVSRVLSKSTGSNYPAINTSSLSKIRVEIPKPKEQQKIASCLSSLDDLLAAHNDKLDALKDHKKGLLQNLFPQEGETVPKVRFPEFEDDGEWEETTLEQVADYENGKAHEKDIDENGDFIVANSKFISTEGETVKYTATAYCPANLGDILMVLSDVPNGKAIAKCFYVDEENRYSVNQRICRITATNCDSRFLFYIMDKNAYFLSFDDGVKQTNLRKSDVLEFPFRIPTNPVEQTKIATCISAVDELIKAQTKKIEELNQHKRGLMQGLFPKVEN